MVKAIDCKEIHDTEGRVIASSNVPYILVNYNPTDNVTRHIKMDYDSADGEYVGLRGATGGCTWYAYQYYFEPTEDGKYRISNYNSKHNVKRYIKVQNKDSGTEYAKISGVTDDGSCTWYGYNHCFEKVGNGKYAISNYNSGDNVKRHIKVQNKDSGTEYAKLSAVTDGGSWYGYYFSFVPANFTLKAVLTDFNFGPQQEIDRLLSEKKSVAFRSTEMITANVLGLNVGNEYGEEIQESFSWGLTQSIGVGVETEVKCGVPCLAEGKVKTSITASFGAHQDWSKTNVKNCKANISFTPTETGIYEVGKVVYVSKNVDLPFTARVKMWAIKGDDETKTYGLKGLESILNFNDKFNAKILERNNDHIIAEVTGIMKASYSVHSDNIVKKISDSTVQQSSDQQPDHQSNMSVEISPPANDLTIAQPQPQPQSQQIDVFLTHNWGLNNSNHKRVSAINDALKEKGITTWFDGDRMHGNIVQQMTDGIDNSKIVIAFITKDYIQKVKGENGANDNCKAEFEYAVRRKTADNIITVVMEDGCADTSQWSGAVSAYLGGRLYLDFSDDSKLDSCVANIRREINRIMIHVLLT